MKWEILNSWRARKIMRWNLEYITFAIPFMPNYCLMILRRKPPKDGGPNG